MNPAALDQVGVCVIRIWHERSGRIGLRARLTYTTDIDGAEVSMMAAADADRICDVVHKWIAEYLGAAGGGMDGL